MADDSTYTSVGKFVVGLLGFVVFLGFLAVLLGLFAPVVREHCVDPTNEAFEGSTSEWTFAFPAVGAFDLETDDEFCVRNTPGREALAAVGIWDLPEPQVQLANEFYEPLEEELSGGSDDYFDTIVDLTIENNDKADELFALYESVDDLPSAREFMVRLVHLYQPIHDRMSALTPPTELKDFHNFLLGTNAALITAARQVTAAIDSGVRAQVQNAGTNFDSVFQQGIEDALYLQRRLESVGSAEDLAEIEFPDR